MIKITKETFEHYAYLIEEATYQKVELELHLDYMHATLFIQFPEVGYTYAHKFNNSYFDQQELDYAMDYVLAKVKHIFTISQDDINNLIYQSHRMIYKHVYYMGLNQDCITSLNKGRRMGHTTSMCEFINLNREKYEIIPIVNNMDAVNDIRHRFLHKVYSIDRISIIDFWMGKYIEKPIIIIIDTYSCIEVKKLKRLIETLNYGSIQNRNNVYAIVGLG